MVAAMRRRGFAPADNIEADALALLSLAESQLCAQRGRPAGAALT
jgi:hypothetical protein